MNQISLNSGWQFRQSDFGSGYHRPNEPKNPWRSAIVPGSIHDDLVRHQVINDPYQEQYEAGAQWVSEVEWEFRNIIDWDAQGKSKHQIIRFEGLDTVCDIFLNGLLIGSHDNMFVPIELDVSGKLNNGKNELLLKFKSPVKVGEERRTKYFEAEGLRRDTNNFDERAFVRKAQYMSGWDWGPRLVSCGIWKAVSILDFDARITDFSVRVRHLGGTDWELTTQTERTEGSDLQIEIEGHGSHSGDVRLTLSNPAIWNVNGRGAQPLVRVTASLNSGHSISKRVGFRTLELVQEPDAAGESFEFLVNGERIFAAGANWIPNDSMPGRITRQDMVDQIDRCRLLGFNMLRVWGGGLYESDDFYDACDEAGILVWQDFPYGCSYYPDGPTEVEIAYREASNQVRRLRHHASLALWCGNNENETMWQSKWGGLEQSPHRYYGWNIYTDALPRAVAEHNPETPYIRTSPIGSKSDRPDVLANDGNFGDQHFWDVWHGQGDWYHYTTSKARFCSEFGFASSCHLDLWRTTIADADVANRTDDAVVWHDKTNKGTETFHSYVDTHYPRSEALVDWVYYSQINQRDALRHGIEHFRTNGLCRGSLIWQINDCWPVQSWAVQDYTRRLKPAGFELRRLYADLCLSLHLSTEREVRLLISNELPHDQTCQWVVEAIDVHTGDIKGQHSGEVQVPAKGIIPVRPIDVSEWPPHLTVVKAYLQRLPTTTTWRTLAEPKNVDWGLPRIIAEANGRRLKITVEGLAYDMIVTDAECPLNVKDAATGLPNGAALCIQNSTVEFQCDSPPQKLHVRSMSGSTVVPVAILEASKPT